VSKTNYYKELLQKKADLSVKRSANV